MLSLSGAPVPQPSRKRSRPDSDAGERTSKLRCTCSSSPQRPSSSPICDPDTESLNKPARPLKRRSECVESEFSELETRQRRKRHGTQTPPASSPVFDWVSDLPSEFEGIPESEEQDNMSRAPSLKRTRSDSSASGITVTSDGETNTTVSREAKNSIYENMRYAAVMASKGSFMTDSDDGPLPEEKDLKEKLLWEEATVPNDALLSPEHFVQLRELLRDRSKLQVCMDLHHQLVPSAEILALQYPDQIKHIVEGRNDLWLDNVPFYKKLPQPDHAKAFSPAAFTDVEHRKLRLAPETKSMFVAHHSTLFPFLTAEVKCGKDALDVADKANINSMTIAQRAVYELYRETKQLTKIHRRYLGFSISHDDGAVRIFGHYPMIREEKITYHRERFYEFSPANDEARLRELTSRFVRNVCTKWAPRHLERLKEAIDCLHDPLTPSANSRTPSQTPTVPVDDAAPLTPATSNPDATFVKPRPPSRHTSATVARQNEQHHAELIMQVKQLQNQFEQSQKDAKEQEDKLQRDAKEREDKSQRDAKEREHKLQRDAKEREHKLQRDAKEREDKLQAQLEQHRNEAKEQHAQLMQMLANKLASVQEAGQSSG